MVQFGNAKYRLHWGLICLHSLYWSSVSSCPQELKNLGGIMSHGQVLQADLNCILHSVGKGSPVFAGHVVALNV